MMATVTASEHTALHCAWFRFRVRRTEEALGDAYMMDDPSSASKGVRQTNYQQKD